MRILELFMTVWIIILKDLHMLICLTVQFPIKEPLYIALNRTLVLQAQVQLQGGEGIILLTWERKNRKGDVRVAEGSKTHNNRTFVENTGALLRIIDVTDSDYGTYKVTVTNSNGDQVNAQRDVLKITNPPKASLSMQCSVLGQGAQWDRPVFSWQVDGVDLHKTGDVSEDGSALLLTNPGQNYTCNVDSSQGKSRVRVQFKGTVCFSEINQCFVMTSSNGCLPYFFQMFPDTCGRFKTLYIAPNPETNPQTDSVPKSSSCSCTGWIVFAILELFILLGLIGFFFYCYKKRMSREETI